LKTDFESDCSHDDFIYHLHTDPELPAWLTITYDPSTATITWQADYAPPDHMRSFTIFVDATLARAEGVTTNLTFFKLAVLTPRPFS
jgi:hypothetical protein